MKKRPIILTGAAVIAAGIAGCSSSPPSTPQPAGSLPPLTAHVTVNGKDAGTTHDVKCEQVGGYYHTVTTGDAASGTTATIQFGDKVTANSVEIRNLGGFTGSFWQGTVGNGEASLLGNTYKISGTAVGTSSDDPKKQTTATYEIRANC